MEQLVYILSCLFIKKWEKKFQPQTCLWSELFQFLLRMLDKLCDYFHMVYFFTFFRLWEISWLFDNCPWKNERARKIFCRAWQCKLPFKNCKPILIKETILLLDMKLLFFSAKIFLRKSGWSLHWKNGLKRMQKPSKLIMIPRKNI